MTISLQGCMAVGKTTAVDYVAQKRQDIYVSHENPEPMLQAVRERGLNPTVYQDFIKIQKLFIHAEIRRWEANREKPFVLMDFGPEEIAFFTLHYPKSLGMGWDMETPLRDELAKLRKCYADKVLFLDATEATLRKREEGDTTRKRGSFEHYVANMLPLKLHWFRCHAELNCSFIDVNDLTAEEVGERIIKEFDKG